MAYDEDLTDRFRTALAGRGPFSEKRMMGGACFLVNGNMIGGADRSKAGERRFMFRVGKENAAKAGNLPGAEPMRQGGRTMGGMFFVSEAECNDETMAAWLDLALDFASGLPPKG